MGEKRVGWRRVLDVLRPWRLVRGSAVTSDGSDGGLEEDLLWWLFPGRLAGMAKPLERELPALAERGVGGIVSFLADGALVGCYRRHGFRALLLPIPDGGAPEVGQLEAFVGFVDESLARDEAVVAHCRAGWGRTGTMLAGYLMRHGHSAQEAIARVREVQPHAIQAEVQEAFLRDLRVV